jgi:hypothetical protein
MSTVRVLILFIFINISLQAFGQKQIRKIDYKGNRILLSILPDTLLVDDPESGETKTITGRFLSIEKLNGKKIYDYGTNSLVQPYIATEKSNPDVDFDRYMSSLFKAELDVSGNSSYIVVIDKKGRLACFIPSFGWLDNVVLHPTAREIEGKLTEMKFKPAKKNGKAVPYSFYLRNM